MPYFIYKVFPFHKLEKIAEFAAFPEASAAAKRLRKGEDLPADCRVRVIFAEDVSGAQALLAEVREPRPRFDDDD